MTVLAKEGEESAELNRNKIFGLSNNPVYLFALANNYLLPQSFFLKVKAAL